MAEAYEKYEKTERYTKKTSTRILKEVQKINPKAALSTTYDQAWVILMTEWNIEASLENKDTSTYCQIYRDGSVVHEMTWDKTTAYSEKERDWDWNFVYRTVLEHIIKTRLYKRPKVSKRELNAIKKAEAEKLKAQEKAAKLAEKERLKAEKESAKKKRKRKRTIKA